jgi:hypothetical protein
MSKLLKDDIINLKSKLESIESTLEGQMKDLEVREDKFKKMDNQVGEIIKTQNQIVRLNIGGKKFATTTETLLSVKDTLFYKLILAKHFDLSKEIFFDRSPHMFPYLIDYFRYHKINYTRFNKEQLEELYTEADYYEIGDIADRLDKKNEIDFISFEFNGPSTLVHRLLGLIRLKILRTGAVIRVSVPRHLVGLLLN